MFLPRKILKVKVPPIKCQGIKTKLVGFIANSVLWNGRGRWIEPFLGSGAVLFNMMPPRALVSDVNTHIVDFYKQVQRGNVTPEIVRTYLIESGRELLTRGEDYYYEVRERFNKNGDLLDFLFLSRTCFNGVMRFNKQGKFNVPFCKKPVRLRQGYITKIVNQVAWIAETMRDREWVFESCDWRKTLKACTEDDFVYLDPPYVGRHAEYCNTWTERDAEELAATAGSLPCGFALSMWKENEYRCNSHLDKCWSGNCVKTFSHFYHVGSMKDLRNAMTEALVIKPGFATF
jgi:DNA adenine methylase